MIKIALIRCGAIGGSVAEAILNMEIPQLTLIKALDIYKNQTLKRIQCSRNGTFSKIEDLLALAPDLILEAAGHKSIFDYSAAIIGAGIDFLPMSVGDFANSSLLGELTRLAKLDGTRLYIPSGAIGSLDALRACRLHDKFDEVLLTSS